MLASDFSYDLYIVLQGKIGPLSSSLALAFKSWWKPAFTLSLSGRYSCSAFTSIVLRFQATTYKL